MPLELPAVFFIIHFKLHLVKPIINSKIQLPQLFCFLLLCCRVENLCVSLSNWYQSITILKMGKKPTKLQLDAINEQDGRLNLLDEEVQSVKAEMQRGFGLVHKNLLRVPALEKGLEAVMVKIDQLLSQRGEGTSHAGVTSNRGKSAIEEPTGVPISNGSQLEPRNTDPHKEWGRTEYTAIGFPCPTP